MSSNYPPGVTGSEPEIAGYDDDPNHCEHGHRPLSCPYCWPKIAREVAEAEGRIKGPLGLGSACGRMVGTMRGHETYCCRPKGHPDYPKGCCAW